MKKTGTTIFTLGLAMILVGSLSSGVILAKGRDAEVVIFDCGPSELNEMGFLVTALHIMIGDDDFGIVVATEDGPAATLCVDAIAITLKARFKMESSGSSFNPFFMLENSGALYSRYTFVRNRRGPRNNEE